MKEYQVKKRPARSPTHPGALLREDVLPALELSVSEAARRLRISRRSLHRILAESLSISPEMAVRLGKLCGNGPELWLRMQGAYDLWHAHQRLADEIGHIPAAKAPGGSLDTRSS